ncbi:MAG: hypothetical protein ABIV04_13170 [Massilia sp.]
MIIVLSDSLFSKTHPEIVIELAALIANSRHVVIADTSSLAFKQWSGVAGAFGPRLLQMIASSARLVTARVVQTIVHVHTLNTEWTGDVPKLSVADARSYIPIPFKVFVENNEADRAFLLAYLDKEKRESLIDLQLNHWLIFVHGGGTGDLQKQIAWEGKNTMRADLRCFAYFDNDGLKIASPSRKTLEVAAECARNNIRHHQLNRRAIENYLPISALELWASTQSSTRARYTRRQLTPFKKLSDAERDHFNMKSGPNGDRFVVPYPALNAYESRQLQKGFGKKVATVYSHDKFREKSSRSDFQRAAAEVETLYLKLRSQI